MRYFSDKRPELVSTIATINYGGHFPAGTSYRSLMHYVQMYKSGELKMYDYGDRNLEKYGQDKPPLYPLERI